MSSRHLSENSFGLTRVDFLQQKNLVPSSLAADYDDSNHDDVGKSINVGIGGDALD